MNPERLGLRTPLSNKKIRCQGARHKCFRLTEFPGWIAKLCDDPAFRLPETEQEHCVEKHQHFFGDHIPETHICTPEDVGFPVVLQREIKGRVLAEIEPEELSVEQLHALDDFLELVIPFSEEYDGFDLVGWRETKQGVPNSDRKFFARWSYRIAKSFQLREFLMKDFDIFDSSNLMFDEEGKLWYIDCVETREVENPVTEIRGLEKLYVGLRTMMIDWFRKKHVFRINQENIRNRIFATTDEKSINHTCPFPAPSEKIPTGATSE